MITYLDSLFHLCCGEGGILQTNITGRVWEVLIVYGPHWICPSSRQCALPGSALLRLQGVLLRHCPEWALRFVHFPRLSRSGSQVLCKGTDSVAHVVCALARSEQLRRAGVWRVYCPRLAEHLNHLPGPSHSVCRVHHESTILGVPCVSSGELISGCKPPGGCQLSRIPGRHD